MEFLHFLLFGADCCFLRRTHIFCKAAANMLWKIRQFLAIKIDQVKIFAAAISSFCSDGKKSAFAGFSKGALLIIKRLDNRENKDLFCPLYLREALETA